jgi:hypothetical protein
MSLFEILAKIKLLNDLRVAFKSTNVFTRFMIIAGVITAGVGLYGYKSIKDNSIYVDTIQDGDEKEISKYVLNKCGDKHALSISAISATADYLKLARFRVFLACDFSVTKDCFIDLSALDRYKGGFDVDDNTYFLLKEIALSNEVREINLANFNLDKYSIIKQILAKSPNFKNIHTIWLTAILNKKEEVIYAISMTAWGENYCRDSGYYLRTLKEKLPLSKLWL